MEEGVDGLLLVFLFIQRVFLIVYDADAVGNGGVQGVLVGPLVVLVPGLVALQIVVVLLPIR